METVRLNYRLRPGVGAERALLAEWDRCRWVWNQCVGRDRDLTAEGERPCTGYDLSAELTDWRGRYEWLRAGSQNAQQNAVLRWGKSRQATMKVKGRGLPRFKAKHLTLPTLEYTKRGFTLRDGRLVLANGVTIPVVWHRELPAEPTSVVVTRNAVGHWHASFVVQREAEKWPEARGRIGIDWGVRDVATATDGRFDQPSPGHARGAAKRLAKAQQRMARRAPARGASPSNGYRRAKVEAARIHEHVRRQRLHDSRQWARAVVAENELIAVEDFKPIFLAKSRMARKAADNAVGTYKRTLVMYAQRAGRTVVLVPPAYTTMTCGECGVTRTKRLALSDRTFVCDTCGHAADRDRNAARVILARAETSPAGVEEVRHGSLLSAVVHSESEN